MKEREGRLNVISIFISIFISSFSQFLSQSAKTDEFVLRDDFFHAKKCDIFWEKS